MSNETFETIEAELAKWKAKMSALEGEYEAMRGRWQSNQTEIEWKTRRITRIDEQIAAIGKTVVEGDANEAAAWIIARGQPPVHLVERD